MSLFLPLPDYPSSLLFAPLGFDAGSGLESTPELSGRVLYVSANLDILSLPDGERLWFGLRSSWYRRLDSLVYLWLRERLWAFYEARGELTEETIDMPDKLAFVRQEGLRFGAFTSRSIEVRLKPPKSFTWKYRFPYLLDGKYSFPTDADVDEEE